MRLINPGPGECADRQSILELKMKAVDTGEVKTSQTQTGDVMRTVMKGASKVDISPWMHEHEEIQRYLEQYWFPDFPKIGEQYDALMDELAEVNGELWRLEDEARALRNSGLDHQNNFKETSGKMTATMYRAGVVLFEITEKNDKRAELVSKINNLFGLNVREKVYAGMEQ